MEYDNTNKGALWKTDDSGKKYVLNGNLNVDGKEFVVFAYKNESDAERSPALNLSIAPALNTKQPASAPAPKTTEDLPF
jgi:hypothetical protein